MTKHLCIAAALVCILGIIAALTYRPQPAYDGRSLDEWMVVFSAWTTNSALFPERKKAEEALQQMGEKAVPQLIARLRCRDSTFRLKVKALVAKYPWIPIEPPQPAYQVRIHAAFAIKAIGPAGKAAVPELISMLADNDNTLRAAAVNALARMEQHGLPAVPQLVRALDDSHEDVSRAASYALGKLAPFDPAIIPILKISLQHGHPHVRVQSLNGLLSLSTNRGTYLAEAVNHLNDRSPDVRANALMAAVPYSEFPEALVQITNLLSDTHLGVRLTATNRLHRINSTFPIDRSDYVGPFRFENIEIGRFMDIYAMIAEKRVHIDADMQHVWMSLRIYDAISKDVALAVFEDELRKKNIAIRPLPDGSLRLMNAARR